jgi:Delta7-sterol 5-desaturase
MSRVSEFMIYAFAVWMVAAAINLAYYAVATGSTVLFLRLFWKTGLEDCKIQKRQASGADVRREIRASLNAVMIFSLVAVVVYFGQEAKMLTLYKDVNLIDIPYLVATIAAMIVGHDAYFYWSHRLIHHRRLFNLCHRTHHKSVTPTAFAAWAFDPLEAALNGLFVPLWLLAVPMHQVGLYIFLGIAVMRTAIGHSGVELLPPRLAEERWLSWIVTNTHHDAHHTNMNYNFGLYFTWWDRLMGTERPALRARAPKRARFEAQSGVTEH